jgi:hypothetical protein
VKIVLVPAVLVLAVLDFLSYSISPPGVLNLWFFKATVVTGVLGVIGYGVYLYVKPRKEKKICLDQASYEKKRELEIREILRENPDFQTFCYTCLHFNQDIKACRLDIRNPRARAVRLNDRTQYCLYWEELLLE